MLKWFLSIYRIGVISLLMQGQSLLIAGEADNALPVSATRLSGNTGHCEEDALREKIVPESDWSPNSADSARSFEGWLRWWQYLFLKKPIVMLWRYGGLRLWIYPGNEICRALFVREVYNPNLVVVLQSLLSSGSVFIDAGAHIGDLALLASRIVGKNGHVFAIEPSVRDFRRLVDNVNLNGLGNVISTHRLAVSDQNGKANLLVASEERSSLNTLGVGISSKGVENIGIETVDSITLDDFAERKKITHIDVLLLNIEGSEMRALKGAEKIIERFLPIIVLGVNNSALENNGTTCSALRELITKMGYEMYKIAYEPTFALKKISLGDTIVGICVCMPNGVNPPSLPQPEKSIARRIFEVIIGWFSNKKS
ncbi:MAG: FkbM family methyltransferase [Holosporaceae bacterium]|nr:FkbM family methyltransferase [Holosporaceae bacterium]